MRRCNSWCSLLELDELDDDELDDDEFDDDTVPALVGLGAPNVATPLTALFARRATVELTSLPSGMALTGWSAARAAEARS